VSAIGEFLREIMPSWLSPPAGRRWSSRSAAARQAHTITDGDPRELAREADTVWQHCVDEGQHGEAFPEDAPGKKRLRTPKRAAREKTAGSNDRH
jgi:hypothetical protein